METNFFSKIDRLSDDELCAELKRQSASEQRLTASVVAHLARFQERRLYLGEGYSSAFAYCTEALGYSGGGAYNRITVSRVVRRFPVILQLLARGEVNLTAARLLAPHLTPENHATLLDAARGKSKLQVLEIIASVSPKPPVPSSIRKLPTRGTAGAPNAASASSGLNISPTVNDSPAGVATGGEASGGAAAPEQATSSAAPEQTTASAATPGQRSTSGEPASRQRPAAITPLAPERYKVEFTANAESHARLRRLQALLKHQIPDGDLAEIIDRALILLLRETERKKLAATDRPRQSRGVAPGSRDISAAVKRAVNKRDGERCAFVSPDGHRCGAEGPLQFHHVDPHGAGGKPTVDNVALLCRAHNLYEAEQYFGRMKLPNRKDSTLRESTAPYGIVDSRFIGELPCGLLLGREMGANYTGQADQLRSSG